jgi:hypothetical protein
MDKIELCYFGDECAPGMLIQFILNIKKKDLFMLGGFYFNKILNYLIDDNLENIYNREFFTKNNNICHHLKYKFYFNHDYKYDETGEIYNYEIVKDRFDLKIKNFRDMLSNDNIMPIFINFNKNVNAMEIAKMMLYLRQHKQKLWVIIFTYNNFNPIQHDNVSIIKLENVYDCWWAMKKEEQIKVYREIYSKFINTLEKENIHHDYPNLFKDTYYGKNNNVLQID